MNDAEVAVRVVEAVIARLDWSEGQLYNLTPKGYGEAAGGIYATVWEAVNLAHYPPSDKAKE